MLKNSNLGGHEAGSLDNHLNADEISDDDDSDKYEHKYKKTNSNLGGHEAGSDDNCLHVAPGLGLALHYLRPKSVMFMIIGRP